MLPLCSLQWGMLVKLKIKKSQAATGNYLGTSTISELLHWKGGWQKGRRGSFQPGFCFRKTTYSPHICMDLWHIELDVGNVNIATLNWRPEVQQARGPVLGGGQHLPTHCWERWSCPSARKAGIISVCFLCPGFRSYYQTFNNVNLF